jgi:signal peptidase I
MTSMASASRRDRAFAPPAHAAGRHRSDLLPLLIHDALASGRAVRFRASGSSMHPTIRDGEVIEVAPVAHRHIAPGVVLLYQHRRRMLAHRVVGVTPHDVGEVLELRGDANGACDAPVGADAVVGQVVGVWRNGRVVSVPHRAPRRNSVYHRIVMTIERAVAPLLARAGLR